MNRKALSSAGRFWPQRANLGLSRQKFSDRPSQDPPRRAISIDGQGLTAEVFDGIGMTRKFFGTDGIRGRTNESPMTAEMAQRVGQAAGTYFLRGKHRHRVVIGKDTRLSGYMMESALISGFTSVGMDVVMVGPVPTPAVAKDHRLQQRRPTEVIDVVEVDAGACHPADVGDVTAFAGRDDRGAAEAVEQPQGRPAATSPPWPHCRSRR